MRIPIKQPRFDGKKGSFFFFPWLILVQWCLLNCPKVQLLIGTFDLRIKGQEIDLWVIFSSTWRFTTPHMSPSKKWLGDDPFLFKWPLVRGHLLVVGDVPPFFFSERSETLRIACCLSSGTCRKWTCSWRNLSGSKNCADVLTKVPDKWHLPFFHEDCGLYFPGEVKRIVQETSEVSEVWVGDGFEPSPVLGWLFFSYLFW